MKELFDVLLIAFTIFCESSGEGYSGKIAVGSVIRNRVDSNLFPNIYTEVILQEKQFSCFNDNEIDKHKKRLIKIFYNKQVLNAFKQCLTIAGGVYYNKIEDNTYGALWYVTKDFKNKWTELLTVLVIYDNHKFMG